MTSRRSCCRSGGKPLLRHLVDKFKKRGIDDITVVAGYKAESIDVSGIRLLINHAHASTGQGFKELMERGALLSVA